PRARRAFPTRRSSDLCLWGGIGVVGIVAYYGAKMPAATTWAVPDRPPNVRIVSVNGQLVANRGMTGGEAVGLHEMSPHIPQAVRSEEHTSELQSRENL